MATVKYRLQSNSNNAQIYVRFSISRDLVFQEKIGMTICASEWSKEKSLPKQRDAESKALAVKLRALANEIHKSYNEAAMNGARLTKDWFKGVIDSFFNREAKLPENDNFLSVYLNKIIEINKFSGNIKQSTNRKFIQLQSKILSFEAFKKHKYLISEIDSTFLVDFREYIISEYRLMDSSANAQLRVLKTVLRNAHSNGKTVQHQVYSFKIKQVRSVKVFLSFDEVAKIRDTNMVGTNLNYAKDWLVIGCYTGQRVSDLLRMNKSMISTRIDNEGDKFQILELIQEKTKTAVSIPLHPEVQNILKKYKGDFPPTFGVTKDSNFVLFNRYIKRVCEIAGINNVISGRVFNKTLRKNEIVSTEKYKLVTSHICRRSFATNFYGDNRFTTPQIMAITGHKSEAVFLSYIGKTSNDHALQTAKTFKQIAI
ncbi:MAG: phage integrase SAM-like domain-containing protein [Weeksellaceae bacterium]|nr:phage integrase SAM-like domain-containing protein [Weeksellaceae bacterium]